MTAQGSVAPGAESVGQARIVTEFGKQFDMGELFRGVEEGAWMDVEANGGDQAMTVDAEGQDVEMAEAV